MTRQIEKKSKTLVVEFFRDERGTTAIEYGLIAALIATVCVGAMTTLGSTLVSNYYDEIAASF